MHIIKGIRARAPLAANGRRLWLYLQRKTCFGSAQSSTTSPSDCTSLSTGPSLPSTPLFASFDGVQAAAGTSIDLSRSCTAETLSTSSSSSSTEEEPICRLPQAYDLERTLNGNLGHFLTPIHLARQRRSGKLFIIKQVRIPTDDEDDDDDDEGNWPIEASLLADLAHPNIIALESVHIDRDCEEGEEEAVCNIVLPYCSGGDVQDFVSSRSAVGAKVPMPFLYHFASSMIDALSFVHQGVTYDAEAKQLHREFNHPEIIHRDIKLQNIFLDRSRPAENGLPTVVLADFGLATTAEKNFLVHGTEGYFAPEVSAAQLVLDNHYFTMPHAVRAKLVNEPIMTTASDWWAFGCCLYQLMNGQPYTYSSTPGGDADADAEAGITDELDLLLYRCLRPDPHMRPRATDLDLHLLSAKFKAAAQAWHDEGGRLEEDIWPEPFWFERANCEAESQSASGSTSFAGSDGQAAAGAQSPYGIAKDSGSRV